MPVDWRLGGGGFDALEALQSYGQAAQQRFAMQQHQTALAQQQRLQAARQQAAGQLQAGDYQGATATAFSAGDLDFAKQIDGLHDDHVKQLHDEAAGISNLAYSLRGVPENERAAAAAPVLAQMGVDPSHIAQIDWSDNGLRAYYGWGQSVQQQAAARLAELRGEDIGVDNARQDMLAGNTIANTTARLQLARNADARGARADARAAAARAEGHVRFTERDKDRAAIAAGGWGGMRTDTDDLDY